MFERLDNLPQNTTVATGISAEEADIYESNRFQKRRRTRQLDAMEKTFAEHVFCLAGKEAARVVDVPCGSGRFYEVFRTAEQLILGDYSEHMLDVTAKKIGSAQNTKMLQCEISKIPLEEDSADLFFCMRLFHHMQTDQARQNALSELSRISRRYVAFSFYCQDNLHYHWRTFWKKRLRGNYVSFAHMNELAQNAGLKLVERFPKRGFTEKQCLVVFEVAK
jgi:ubiquinone/menaquinone biosynthesis C-methylase UbiE